MSNDSKIQIASRYALALYLAAEEKKKIHEIGGDISTLLGIIKKDKDIIKDLSNPLWDADSKKNTLKLIGKKLKLSQETINCLGLVVDNNRTKDLELILEGFRKVYFKKHNITLVHVESVKELTPSQEKKLISNLEEKTSSKILLEYKIDPEILGGLIIRYGSEMIDDSVKGKLNKLETIMKGV
jgi:F-type H+-transporting ATPase subunit delta